MNVNNNNTQNQYYFAYGSNLLRDRIALSIPHVEFKCAGFLKDYQLVFSGPVTKRWKGAAANILPSPGKYVYGAIYNINQVDLECLDIQEAVPQGHYKRLTVDVETVDDNKQILRCVTYVKSDSNEIINPPSLAYKSVIINGATSIGLPNDYIEFLKSVPDNGYDGDVPVALPDKFFHFENH